MENKKMTKKLTPKQLENLIQLAYEITFSSFMSVPSQKGRASGKELRTLSVGIGCTCLAIFSKLGYRADQISEISLMVGKRILTNIAKVDKLDKNKDNTMATKKKACSKKKK